MNKLQDDRRYKETVKMIEETEMNRNKKYFSSMKIVSSHCEGVNPLRSLSGALKEFT